MEGEISFEMEEISSDQFLLQVWKRLPGYKINIASFMLDPNSYAELTTTLQNFAKEEGGSGWEPEKMEPYDKVLKLGTKMREVPMEQKKDYQIKVTRIVRESMVMEYTAGSLEEAIEMGRKDGDLTHDDVLWNTESTSVLDPVEWIEEEESRP